MIIISISLIDKDEDKYKHYKLSVDAVRKL